MTSSSKIVVVDNLAMGNQICAQIRDEGVVAMDCDSVSLGPTGSLSLVQISVPSNAVTSCWIFDIFKCPHLVQPLREAVFENQAMLKIIHDCRGERSNLCEQFGVQLANVFDTQIAFHMMRGQRDNKRTSLTNLLRYYRLPENPMKVGYGVDFYAAHPRFWEERPLTPEMIRYAAIDIEHLHYFYKRMENFEDNATFKRRCAEADLREADIFLANGERNPNMRFFT